MEKPAPPPSSGDAGPSFLARHEFLLRRLHSLSGLIPVGAYMVVHLATNASVLAGAATFQGNVDKIHALGPILPLVEWTFIFIPILFHALFGFVIIAGALPNTSSYPYAKNYRYTLQRITGVLAFVYIAFHIWQLHHYGEPFGGGKFEVDHATSSTAVALDSLPVKIAYAVGLLACVYHLANGIWTMGITWGVWVSPAAQRRADYVCAGFGVLIAVVGLGAMQGFGDVNVDEARETENRLIEVKEMLKGERPVTQGASAK
ncbi:MAG: succinate dehydrogenase [Planctomycetota bacterium]|nr:MAG: succinate dehydrogenase [Planctomycetota bacterium]